MTVDDFTRFVAPLLLTLQRKLAPRVRIPSETTWVGADPTDAFAREAIAQLTLEPAADAGLLLTAATHASVRERLKLERTPTPVGMVDVLIVKHGLHPLRLPAIGRQVKARAN